MNREEGFSLALVLAACLFIMVVGLGMLSLLTSGLHGTVLRERVMQALHVAEAGLNFGVAELVDRAAQSPADEEYSGESDDVAMLGRASSARGTFRVTVSCLYPAEAIPPACGDDPATEAIDERDFRQVISRGIVSGRSGQVRRHLEATVRRYTITPGDVGVFGICGRERVELAQGTSVIADVGSNGEVLIDGPVRPQGTVGARLPRAPSVAPVVEARAAKGRPGLSGTYSWRVTFIDTNGVESGGSPPTAVVNLVSEHARLTDIPSEDGIVRRRIYRTPANAPGGPWFLVAEIPDNTTQEYTDAQRDEALRHRIPGAITGSVTAAGGVSCSLDCASQVDGQVRSSVRDVVCPNYLQPSVQPGIDPAPDPIVQTETNQTMHFGSLIVRRHRGLTIQTLSTPNAELHIHLSDIYLESGATLAVTGAATVYLHVSGTFFLEEDAVLGAVDFSGNLVRSADRIHVLVSARDPALDKSGVASVQLAGNNKIAALVFAPNANIVLDRAVAFRGALFGKHIRITQSAGFFLDPIEGMGSERSAIRFSPFQYVTRWYDNPRSTP